MSKLERVDHFLAQSGPCSAPPDRDERSATAAAGKTVTRDLEARETPLKTPSPATEPPEGVAQNVPAAEAAPHARRRHRLRGALLALLPIALIAGGYWYVVGGGVMSTDDAYVEADKVGISTDVSGIVKEVDVTEN